MHSPQQQLRHFFPAQLLRLALTPTLLIAVALQRTPRLAVVYIALALLALDMVDCHVADASAKAFWKPTVAGGDSSIRGCGASAWYRVGDKLLDQAQYAAALLLLWGMYFHNSPACCAARWQLWVLLAAWLWRMAGVAVLIRADDGSGKRLELLTAFPDVFKELLLTWAAAATSHGIAQRVAVVAAVVACKSVFEYFKAVFEYWWLRNNCALTGTCTAGEAVVSAAAGSVAGQEEAGSVVA